MQRITRSEIARLAGVSRAAVTQWGKRHRDFPRPDDGGRFALAEVTRWLESRNVRASPQASDGRADQSYADRIRHSLAAAAWADPPALLPGDGPTAEPDNLTLRLALVFLRARNPQAWAALNELITPDTGAVGARWLLDQIATAAEKAARQHGVRPETFGALRRLAPEQVSQVRGLMAHYAQSDPADVQTIIDEYESALSSGSFLTPRGLATLLAEAVIDHSTESLYDPYVRGGELLTAAVDAAGRPGRLRLHGLGSHPAALSLSGVNLMTRGEAPDLRLPHEPHPARVDVVLANPPFGGMSWIDQQPDSYWFPFPAPPARSAFRWLLHCLQLLHEGGRIAIIMPSTAASSANPRERVIRRRLLDQSMVEGVIALPPGLYASRAIATSIWIVRHPPGSDQPILFVDTANLEAPGNVRAAFDEAMRDAILRAWRSFRADQVTGRPHHGIEHLSIVVPKTVIQADACSLDPAKYVPAPAEVRPAVTDSDRTRLAEPYKRVQDCREAADQAAAVASHPSSAQIVELGDVCEVRTGYSYSQLPADKRTRKQGTPIILPRHLRDGRIVADDPPRAPETLAAALADYQVREGDVLCVRTGALTPPALVGPGEQGRLVSTNLLRLRVHHSDVLDPYYLYAYLRSAAGTTQMKTFARSTATAYVAAADLAAMKIPLPSPHRQRALAAALHALDEEVKATQDLATRIAAARDAITHRLFGGVQ